MTFTFAGQYTQELLAAVSGVAASLPLMSVNVYQVGTTTPVTLYTSRTKGSTTANPVSTDANSNVTFFVDPGQYDIVFTPPGGSQKRITISVPADGAEASGTYKQYFIASVVGDGTTDDTAAVQAQLTAANAAGGGQVLVPFKGAGTPKIASLLTIYSNTTLELADKVVLTRAGTFTGNFLTNAGATAVATATDGAMTSGSAVLTTALASSAVVGQTVIVGTPYLAAPNGPGLGNSLLCANITAVGVGTVTLSLPARATVTGSHVALYTRDSNIKIKLGAGARFALGANAGPANNGVHHLYWRHVDGLSVEGVLDLSTTSGKYAWHAADCTDVTIPRAKLAASSDGLHFSGPCSRVTIGTVTGSSGDDSVAFTASNGPTYYFYNDCEGAITDVEVDNIRSNSGGATCLKLTTNSNYGTYLSRVHAGTVAHTGDGDAVALGADTGPLDVRGLDIGSIFGTMYTHDGSVPSIHIGSFHVPASPAGVTTNAGLAMAATICDLVQIDSVYGKQTTDTYFVMLSTATIGQLSIGDFYWNTTADYVVYYADAANSVGAVTLGPGLHTGASQGGLINTLAGGTLTDLFVTDVKQVLPAWIGAFGTTTTVHLKGLSSNGGGCFVGAGGAVTVVGADNSAGAASLSGGGTIAIAAKDAQVTTAETTTTTTFTDLATAGPAVTVKIGTSGAALVSVSASEQNNTGGAYSVAGVAVSGASTVAASDSKAAWTSVTGEIQHTRTFLLTGLTPGSNTFTVKYRVTGGTGTFSQREITVVPL